MRKSLKVFLYSIGLIYISSSFSALRAESDRPASGVKEWTFLVYLNGNNNLDSFGDMNVKQMEKVGSTADINVVVQWASLAKRKTQRLYIVKSQNPSQIASPVVQDMGKVDMGDWRSVVEFVRWGVENYPAKHYFVDIWDHGSGWRALKSRLATVRSGVNITDISWDDNTGHSISTVQLGQALAESAKIIGHKIDLYASDACLMAMAEVADEVADSVDVFGGSEEVEPGAGWPYDAFLRRWTNQPLSTPAEVSKMLTEEYIQSYSGGQNGNMDATFSAFDLSKMESVNQSIAQLGRTLSKLSPESRSTVMRVARNTQSYTYSDYGDLGDFMTLLEKANITDLGREITGGLKSALNEFVVANGTTDGMSRSTGTAIWLPTSLRTYNTYSEKYRTLKFDAHTQWGDALRSLLQ